MSAPSQLHQALAHCLARHLTFTAFRVPGGPVTLWVQRSPELEPVESAYLARLNEVFLVAPFKHDPQRITYVRSDVELTFGELPVSLESLHTCIGGTPAGRTPAVDMDRTAYEALVKEALEVIGAGGLEKVVASRTITLDLDRTSLPTLFEEAATRMSNALVALVHTPEHGTWMGASPEHLLVAEDDRVRIDALAGTRGSTEPPLPAASWGTKERHEQALVTREVVGCLIELGLPAISIMGPEPMNAGQVSHLRTVIEADLGSCSLDEVLTRLHPTPAICGTPRGAAQRFIHGHDGPGRGLYSGFWGPWNADGRTELFVNIRCLEAFDQRATLHVGAGITAGSDAGDEWTETEAKASVWTTPIRTLATGREATMAR